MDARFRGSFSKGLNEGTDTAGTSWMMMENSQDGVESLLYNGS